MLLPQFNRFVCDLSIQLENMGITKKRLGLLIKLRVSRETTPTKKLNFANDGKIEAVNE